MRLLLLMLLLCVYGCSSRKAQLEIARKHYEARQFKQAFSEFMPLAENGVPEAQYYIGSIWYAGYGVNIDLNKAFEWYLKAAQNDYPEAQYNISQMYFTGEGVAKDAKQAVEWLKKAANQGFAQAQINLSACYYSGTMIEQDYMKAVKWLNRAAEKDDPIALVRLAKMYIDGKGVMKNYAIALKHLQRASQQNQAEAQFMLAKMYIKGIGVGKDRKTGNYMLVLSAKNGCAEAQMVTGLLCLIQGEKELAGKWFDLARQQGEDIEKYIQEAKKLGMFNKNYLMRKEKNSILDDEINIIENPTIFDQNKIFDILRPVKVFSPKANELSPQNQ